MQFYLVYIREAHPVDGGAAPQNAREGIQILQPKTLEERLGVAEQMCTKLDLKLPALIDGLDDQVGRAYGAWPDRLCLIGRDGKIVYPGAPGPGGFRPAALREALEKAVGPPRESPTPAAPSAAPRERAPK